MKKICIWIIQLAKNYVCFFLYLHRFPSTDPFVLSLNLDLNAARLNSVQIMAKVMILKQKDLENNGS